MIYNDLTIFDIYSIIYTTDLFIHYVSFMLYNSLAQHCSIIYAISCILQITIYCQASISSYFLIPITSYLSIQLILFLFIL